MPIRTTEQGAVMHILRSTSGVDFLSTALVRSPRVVLQRNGFFLDITGRPGRLGRHGFGSCPEGHVGRWARTAASHSASTVYSCRRMTQPIRVLLVDLLSLT